MQNYKKVTIILFSLIITACSVGAVRPLSEQARIVSAVPDIANDHYKVLIIEVDGKRVSGNGQREAIWLEPGEHEIKVVAFLGGGKPLVRTLHQPKSELPGTMTLNVEAGKRYLLAAKLEGNRTGDWKPVVVSVQ